MSPFSLLNRINYERTQSMPHSEEAFKLDRMRELLRRLGNPQQTMPTIHIAGTKGKGSTAAMTAAMLSAAGYRTGLFTSPHIERVEERIVVDGLPCPADALAAVLARIRPAVEALDIEAAEKNPPEHGPTYFEILTAAAWCYFEQCKADIAVMEVGLGGRLDSTNVCSPLVTLITSISFDHTKQLGETLAAIAAEKAGILKPGVPVISGVTPDEPREVVHEVAAANGCRLFELGRDFDFAYRPPRHLEREPSPAQVDFRQTDSKNHGYTDIGLNLPGRHQAANAALAIATIEELRRQGWNISESAVRRGLAEVAWPARVEVVARHPAVVLDAAHNVASIAALIESLAESFSVRRRLLVFATTREKDIDGMLQRLLGYFDHIIFTRYLENPRSVPPEELHAAAKIASPRPLGEGPGVRVVATEIAPTPGEAWNIIQRIATPEDLVCITGSFFLAAEMRRQIAASLS
jgi:dihydrofolate synthase/folylpolyglutamate synthase